MKTTSITPADIDRLENTLVHCPGVARAQVGLDGRNRLAARVLPWLPPTDWTESGVLDELAGVTSTETQFLYEEIFVAESYLHGGIVLREDAVVFDVGANIGMFTLFVGSRCPSARVYAFEPVPDVVSRLRRNIERHGVDARLTPVGLSDHDHEVTFDFYPDISIMSCRSDYADPEQETEVVTQYGDTVRRLGSDARRQHLAEVDALLEKGLLAEERRCRLRRTSAVIEESGVSRVDLLKIDTQRGELDVLRGIDARHWPLVQQISVEVHDEAGRSTEGRLDTVRALLLEQGFRVTTADVVEGSGQHTVSAVRPEYGDDPRPVVAAAGDTHRLTPDTVRRWLTGRLPEQLIPQQLEVVPALN
ncbi:FkbM family methyltransferase [Streptomyces sp. A012304]|uniref:FkbM family methyltransferase n=1 Tax=Streptomyces sp. A012304 TaxID=375446 RepID=UPI002230ECBE|nr:FkbM family methyltransferase [Streptomyces sp. A012304]GKQ41831.1 hypothetical protein ALMP_83440 [Streptomyces sp. A012304]